MIKIFTEGRDIEFLKVYIEYLQSQKVINQEIKIDYIKVGGYTNLAKDDVQFQENTDAGRKNILIFDADAAENGGGHQVRSDYLTTKKAELAIEFEQFLFPNDAAEGDYETLLENIINAEHRGLIDCFLEYENCVGQYNEVGLPPKYDLPVRKSRIYAYIDAFPKDEKEEKKFKRGYFFYENPYYWNLDAKYLEPLKAFLIAHIG
jgi:hypothetical protein